jgi:hypothetical protein
MTIDRNTKRCARPRLTSGEGDVGPPIAVFLVLPGLHLLLLLDWPRGLRSFSEPHPPGGQINRDGPVLWTLHLTRADEITARIPAVLFRIHPTCPSQDFPATPK